MTVLTLDSKLGQPLALDLCFACHGIWVDGSESQQMTPQSVLTLFSELHAHKDEPTQALKARMRCPRCPSDLVRGSDRTRSGEYVVYRCANRHGRFGTFSSFMVEKGFVRHMTQAEITDLAQRVGAVYCTSCGAPVDIRKDHACPYCRAAFSLLDPEAVSKALEGYARTRATGETGSPVDIADALIVIERDRNRAERERQQQGLRSMGQSASSHELTGDLLAAGVELVWRTLFR